MSFMGETMSSKNQQASNPQIQKNAKTKDRTSESYAWLKKKR